LLWSKGGWCAGLNLQPSCAHCLEIWVPNILEISRPDQTCIGITFCFVYILVLTSLASRGQTNRFQTHVHVFPHQPIYITCQWLSDFSHDQKIVSFVGLEKQTISIPTQQAMPAPTEQKVPYLLSKLYMHLRSKQYPYLLSKQYPHLLSNQKVLVGLAIMVFSLCYTRF
jgi:hypothetical protein